MRREGGKERVALLISGDMDPFPVSPQIKHTFTNAHITNEQTKYTNHAYYSMCAQTHIQYNKLYLIRNTTMQMDITANKNQLPFP